MWPFNRRLELKDTSLDAMLRTLASLNKTKSGVSVTPDNCMRSPTVHAIVTAVQNRLKISPIHVLKKSTKNGRAVKEDLPNHPVARLLRKPNGWQTREEYVGDSVSSLLRYGRFHAAISRGQTGPIRLLTPLEANQVDVEMNRDTWVMSFRYNGKPIDKRGMHYVRLGARNFYKGDSPVEDVRESIALEIAAEEYAATYFGNGAMPLFFFKLMDGFKEFNTNDEKKEFLAEFKQAFGGEKKFSAGMMPKGMEVTPVPVNNDKAQFIETRRFIRTVIAGAWGVPPHLVGDLERATFNNVEQQDTDFTINVILPIARSIESALERDCLTDEDRNAGIVVRFNLDAVQRADIKTRSESLKIEREAGVINVNEWREQTNRNPISEEDGGEEYIRPMNMQQSGDEPEDEDPDNEPENP